MSDLMRKEFEQAVVNMHVSHGVPPEDAAAFLEIGSNGYRSVSTKSAWWAWQASRECLVIDLPDTKEIMPLSPGMYVHEMRKIVDENKYTRAIDLARCAIHAAGVKTK